MIASISKPFHETKHLEEDHNMQQKIKENGTLTNCVSMKIYGAKDKRQKIGKIIKVVVIIIKNKTKTRAQHMGANAWL